MSWKFTLWMRTNPRPLFAANIWESTILRQVTPKPIRNPATIDGSMEGKTTNRKSCRRERRS
jgi:hypothetical protein